MRVEDLKVGLIVNIKRQVTNIDGDYDLVDDVRELTLDDFWFFQQNRWNDTDFDEFVHPVPITNDVLALSGFEFVNGFTAKMWYINKELHCYLVEYPEDIPLACGTYRAHFRKNGLEECVLEINYIHELQVLMKLYGIERKIILPKQ